MSRETMLSWQKALASAQQSFAANDIASAYPLFQQLAEKLPQHGEIRFGYAQVLLRIEHFDQAIQELQIACHLLPKNSDCLFALADAFDKVDAQKDVKTVLNYIAQGFASEPEVLYKLAHYARETGDIEDAKQFAECCINLSNLPLLSAYAWHLLVHLPLTLSLEQYEESEQNIKQLLAASFDKLEPGKQQHEFNMLIHYALGRLYELLDEPDKAFAAWKSANQLQRQFCQFSCDDMLAYFEDLKHVNTPLVQNPKQLNFTPVFILGLPRTGSTLLEQLLSQHPLFTSLGEQAILAQHATAYLSNATGCPYPALLQKMTQEQATKAASIYYKALLRRQRNSPFVIDKLPANFQSIDLIFTLFPDAKVIDIRRNTAAVALSVFKNFFAEHEPYFCDLQEFSQYQGFYEDCMACFKLRYSDKILDVHYEDLVRHPTSVLGKVFDFCNVQTNVSEKEIARICELSNKQTTRVSTLSATQVKQGISDASVNKYSLYLPLMQQAGLVV